MAAFALPILYALFVWWFSTGVIIYLDGLPRRTYRWSMLGATIVFVLSLYGLAATAEDNTVRGAYLAFTFGLLAWGWHEISYFMGYVTGPRSVPCPEGCSGWKHFVHAIETGLWHELAIVASALVVVSFTWSGGNEIGLWTFMVLWWMRMSAKLNVFFGVRNLNEQFLPDHLHYLKSFLKKKPMNLFFPVSVTVSTIVNVALVEAALAPDATAHEVAGYTFLATLMALAVLEHWFLVLPLPAEKLWNWSMTSRNAAMPVDVQIVSGFLGAGKTTFLRRLLAQADPKVRTVVLVNGFSADGVDGSLLSGLGADVVDLPNGCICCSMKADLATQLKQAIAQWHPQRILVEPSGVADLTALLGVLAQPDLRSLVRSLRLTTVIDAEAFMRDYARLPAYFETQARLSPVIIANKADLVRPAELRLIADTFKRLNPAATVVPASFGVVEDGELDALLVNPCMLDRSPSGEHAHPGNGEPVADDQGKPALGLSSWSANLAGTCDIDELNALLEAVAQGAFGQVERVKGITRLGAGWVSFDVAGGRSSIAAFAPQQREKARVVAIGRDVDEVRLRAAFEACATPYMQAA
ncbi:MAG: putative photosynthetic complex assembly protein PuhE [Geminicoccaceae bacterium]